MDNIRALSIVTRGNGAQRPSRLSGSTASINDGHALEFDGFNDFRSANLARRRSSRVSLSIIHSIPLKII